MEGVEEETCQDGGRVALLPVESLEEVEGEEDPHPREVQGEGEEEEEGKVPHLQVGRLGVEGEEEVLHATHRDDEVHDDGLLCGTGKTIT